MRIDQEAFRYVHSGPTMTIGATVIGARRLVRELREIGLLYPELRLIDVLSLGAPER